MREDSGRTYYLIFNSIHDVIKAEKRLKKGGFKFELIPVPRNLSSDCGSCIRLYSEFADAIICLDDVQVQRGFAFDGKDYEALSLDQAEAS